MDGETMERRAELVKLEWKIEAFFRESEENDTFRAGEALELLEHIYRTLSGRDLTTTTTTEG